MFGKERKRKEEESEERIASIPLDYFTPCTRARFAWMIFRFFF